MPQADAADHARIAIVGGGSIGTAWAVVFARAGRPVAVYEPDPERRAAAAREMRAHLADLAGFGLLGEPAEAAARATFTGDLAQALAGAAHVQECAPENLALKQELLAALDRAAPPGAVIASSSSAITASAMAGDLPGRHRCLVVHPGNPPTLLRAVEVVPAPFTEPDAVRRTMALLEAAGMAPVLVRREIEGFVFNRLQGALLREAYCLVRDGVVAVEDVDRIVREGLGPRWSVIGPFETADLNTRGGIAAHAARMGPAYARMGAERGQDDPWTPDLVAEVERQRRALLPIERWAERVAWRDRRLMALARAKAEAEERGASG
ncbi:MAG TPA: 3-hydroxyacyl-CoA dehydrogenase [Microvirga sp.]|jgi:3-hydroxyacyl-CoA dehydrogenase|nr:3-hydroxyacyl-CoA dehydrogenase [Microvirga sp.]